MWRQIIICTRSTVKFQVNCFFFLNYNEKKIFFLQNIIVIGNHVIFNGFNWKKKFKKFKNSKKNQKIYNKNPKKTENFIFQKLDLFFLKFSTVVRIEIEDKQRKKET